MNRIFLLLGSNLGDRRKMLSQTMELIKFRVGNVVMHSSVFETAPWGNVNQPSFYNQVIAAQSILDPSDLLHVCKKIEKDAGREVSEKWGPRLIDVDILFYGDKVLNSEQLIIPHPQLHLRRFTLEPLNEIAPDFTHPVLKKTVSELLHCCPDQSQVNKLSADEI